MGLVTGSFLCIWSTNRTRSTLARKRTFGTCTNNEVGTFSQLVNASANRMRQPPVEVVDKSHEHRRGQSRSKFRILSFSRLFLSKFLSEWSSWWTRTRRVDCQFFFSTGNNRHIDSSIFVFVHLVNFITQLFFLACLFCCVAPLPIQP